LSLYLPNPLASTSTSEIEIADGISFSTDATDNSPSPTLVTSMSYELSCLPRFIVPGDIDP